MGFNPSSVDVPSFTVDNVQKELLEQSMGAVRFRTAVESGRLTLREPGRRVVEEILNSAAGDRPALSDADVKVLALALELAQEGHETTIVSDDYAIQNVSESLKIAHASLANFGITHKFEWIHYCPACFKRYEDPPASMVCVVCGTKLKRRVLRRKLVDRGTFASKVG